MDERTQINNLPKPERKLKEKLLDGEGKMLVDCEHALFRKQTNRISTGNVNAKTQRSRWIRPWNTQDGDDAPGDAMKRDMRGFSEIGSDGILNSLYDISRKERVILYEFYVKEWNPKLGSGMHKDVLGHVLTDSKGKLLSYVIYKPGRTSAEKRRSAVFEAMNYVVDGWCEMSETERLMWRNRRAV